MTVNDAGTQERQVVLTCPYCGQVETIPGPEGLAAAPREVECLPYARDIGRFDHTGWSQVGQDFFGRVLGWERIGILRTVGDAVVNYRVAECRVCHELFDVYARYSDGPTLGEMWPHLLRPGGGEGQGGREIVPYAGETTTVRVVRRLARLLLGDELGASLVVGVAAFLLSWLPLALQLASGGTWSEALTAYGAELALRAGGAVCLTLLLHQFCLYLRFLREGEGFERLLRVRERRGVTYWRNFSLSRFIGVQQEGSRPAATQVTVVAGIPSVVLLCGAWIWSTSAAHRWSLSAGQALLWLVVELLVAFVLGSLADRLRPRADHRGMTLRRGLLRVVLPLRAGGVMAVMAVLLGWVVYLLALTGAGPGAVAMLDQVFALLFWGLVVYYVGIAVWLSFNTSLYLLKGLSKIPMRLSPLNRFSGSEAMERIAVFSSTTNLIVFVFGVLLVSVSALEQADVLHPSVSAAWLLGWGRWGLIVLYAALAIGTAGSFVSSLVVGLAYLLLSILASRLPVLTVGAVTLSYQTVLFGLFVTYLLYFHFRSCRAPIEAVKRKAKRQLLGEYEEQLVQVQGELNRMGLLAGPVGTVEDWQILTRRNLLRQELDNLMSIRQRIADVPVAVTTRYSEAARILSPLVTSIALPTIIDRVQGWVGSLLAGSL